MLTLAPPVAIVKPADLNATPAPIAIVAAPDDFEPIPDDMWEAMYEASSATDAVCSGHWAF